MPQAYPSPTTRGLFTPAFLQDPYPHYRPFLEEGGIHRLDYGGGIWAIFRHADCSTFLRDPRLSSRRIDSFVSALPADQRTKFADLARMLSLWMLFFDAPEHTRLRKLMNKGFAPAVVESLRPRVEAIVDRMLEPLRHTSEADLLREIAHPLPARVIAELLGVPEELHQQLVQWSDAIAVFIGNRDRTLGQIESAQNAVIALTNFFRQVVAEHSRQKRSDLVGLLLEIEEDGEVLTEDELYAQCVMLLFGGHETTRNLIGNGMYTLLAHPSEAAKLRDNPEMIRTAAEELLRYESPVQYTSRTVKEEMEICGVRVNRGDSLLCTLGAANRDPRQFHEPDTLNLRRVNNPHLAFGAGAHFCIGNQLARLEGQVAILRMIQGFPKMRLAPPQVEWVPNAGLRGLRSLPVTI